MHLHPPLSILSLLTALCTAAALPNPQALELSLNNTTPIPSAPFILHSRPVNQSTFDTSLGYLHAEYVYPPGYYGTLRGREDAIVGVVTDTRSGIRTASFIFPQGSGYYRGFVLYPLTQQYPFHLTTIFSGQNGTMGIYIDDMGTLKKYESEEMGWYACPNTPLEWGRATALYIKLASYQTPAGCTDVDLVVEYV